MNNTELTLDQLSEVAGGPHYTTYGGSSFMTKPVDLKSGLHDSVHCFRGKQARRLSVKNICTGLAR